MDIPHLRCICCVPSCRLPPSAMMASFASLRDFGNTSSASTWYTWSYVESTTGIKKGDRVLQVRPGFVRLVMT